MKKTAILFVIAVVTLCGVSAAQMSIEEEVKKVILERSAWSNENNKNAPSTVSKDGSLEFWSSGGLVQHVSPDAEAGDYENININPKHIKVIPLADGIAVAMYYSEGSMQPKNSEAVRHYMTRVTQVFVKEGDSWKVRAAHWSPIAGGSGTSQTALD